MARSVRKSEEDRFEYRLENDPRFLRRIEQARNSLRAGRGIKLEDDRNRMMAPKPPTPHGSSAPARRRADRR